MFTNTKEPTHLKLFHFLFHHLLEHLLQLSVSFGPLFSSGLPKLWEILEGLQEDSLSQRAPSSKPPLCLRALFLSCSVSADSSLLKLFHDINVGNGPHLPLPDSLVDLLGLIFQEVFETFDLILTLLQCRLKVHHLFMQMLLFSVWKCSKWRQKYKFSLDLTAEPAGTTLVPQKPTSSNISNRRSLIEISDWAEMKLSSVCLRRLKPSYQAERLHLISCCPVATADVRHFCPKSWAVVVKLDVAELLRPTSSSHCFSMWT